MVRTVALLLAVVTCAAGFVVRPSAQTPSTVARAFPWEKKAPPPPEPEPEPEKKKGFFGGFFEEIDNFADDAFGRKLGNGASFYGKRKS